ncbi:hypothetical protein PGB90_003132 [Kerria lacca]
MAIDELVDSITIYKTLPLYFHGEVFPFLGLYIITVYFGIYVYDYEEYGEIFMLLIAVLAVLQVLACLCCFWSVHIRCFLSCRKVKTPYEGEIAKIIPTPNNGHSELVKLNHCLHEATRDGVVWFVFQKTKYIWCPDKKTFCSLEFPISNSFGEYLRWKGYIGEEELFEATQKYGFNILDMMVPEFMELFIERATAPFFVFQVLCVILWCLDRYWYYSLFTLIMLVVFECTLVKQQMRNMAEIRNMGNKPYNVQVYRNKRWKSILSDRLLPGDIISIGRSHNNNPVPCDLLLIRGPCIVDESMLTGEAVPQMKEPIENFDPNKVLDLEIDGKLHVLFGGTKVVQHTPPSKTSAGIRAQDNGCVAYVLRTGFSTSQGKLLRTILFGVKRVTANNLETLAFILFLLIFAIAASTYVWIKGSEDVKRNRYKLFLECILILTSVIPPELPVELSLAVNSSLLSLAKLYVFCTEPFRIPFAGKVQVCCFDKTGTLTSNNLVVEGIAGVGENKTRVLPVSEAPQTSVQVLATCHSLVQLDDGIVGDPLEKATLSAVDWNLTKGDAVIPKRGKYPGMKIFHRFHFSSSLKRMSVLAGYTPPGSTETNYVATVKGAPETLKSMFINVDETYDRIYLGLSRRGARVLALGWKEIGRLSHQQVKDVNREFLESDLHFSGFIIISCPLKPDSKVVIKELLISTHMVVMITGDNPLTACHVAKELLFTQKKGGTLILTKQNDIKNSWAWQSIDENIILPLEKNLDCDKLTANYDLCVTGDGLIYTNEQHPKYIKKLIKNVSVFARVSPKQKELVIVLLKSLGYVTLMCGDGTNDVGALKHADVGVALIPNSSDKIVEKVKKSESIKLNSRNDKHKLITTRNANEKTENMRKMLKEIDDGLPKVVKLGDASIAAPFTSKLSSIQCICHVIKQGRCTLVTTLQMFKILALNALIIAYGQSVLYIDGIKFSDTQATLQGLLLAACFLFISRTQPLKTLSPQRPLPNIFNIYTITTVLLQFAVHFCTLVFLVHKSRTYSPVPENILNHILDDKESEFEPNVTNSTVYIISIMVQVVTFAINYRGRPFMESLSDNRSLLYTLIMSSCLVFALCLGISPSFSKSFDIVEFDVEFRFILLATLIVDFCCSFILDRSCLWLFGEGKLNVHH